MRPDLSAVQPEKKAVTIPPWGERTVYVHELTGLERDALDEAADEKGKDCFIYLLLIAACRDEEGKPLFTDADLADLQRQPFRRVLKPLQEAAIEINGLAAASAEKN